jgi:gamma-glutamyl:cysteine ligase YbdK (ATP-grasp superfamily)
MSLSNKLQAAYNSLTDQLVMRMKAAEDVSLHWLGEQLDHLQQNAQELGSEITVLTEHELNEVQDILQRDIEQAAEYLEDSGQGLDAFIENDWPLIEGILSEKALSLADPSQIHHLKLRLQAALAASK